MKLGLSDFPSSHLTSRNGMTPQTPLEEIKMSGDFLRPWDPAQGDGCIRETGKGMVISLYPRRTVFERRSRATKGTALLTGYIWVTNSHHVARVSLCPPAIPALPPSSQPSLSPTAPSFLKRSRGSHTRLFVLMHGWGMNRRFFVSDCTMPFVWGQLWGGAGGGEGAE